MARGRLLTRTGTVCGAAGRRELVFDEAHCAQCNGRCGLRLGTTPRQPLDIDLAAGTTVEVSVPVRALLWRSLAVFGTPLATAGIAAAIVRLAGGGDWIVGAALLSGIAAPVAARYMAPRRNAQPSPVVTTGDGTVRVRLEPTAISR